MGWQDTSVPFHSQQTDFNQRYQTPNMEKLARAAMKFTQAYACSVCSPTRVSLMTGLNAARHRVKNWTLRKNASNDRKHPRLEFPQWNVNGLSPVAGVERTLHAKALPAFLRDAGYLGKHPAPQFDQRHGRAFHVRQRRPQRTGRGGEPNSHNQPLSSGKGSAHEGGVRVPMLAHGLESRIPDPPVISPS